MAKFKINSKVVDAVQWKGTPNQDNSSVVEVYNFLTGSNISGARGAKTEGENFRLNYSGNRPELMIKTPKGEMKAERMDWIIKNDNGEFYPCKPKIFDKNYKAI